jgi:hypothetical protein
LQECPHCDELVPAGPFCGNCGAHFYDPGGRSRFSHYAAAPHEHVLRMAVISSLFPHLPRRHAHLFREAFTAGLVVVVLLCAVRLYTPAVLAAALLLPVLYLLYLYEVEVYQSEPLLVLLATLGVGAAVGTGFTLGFGHLQGATLNGHERGPFFDGLLLPAIAQVAMLAGPLLLVRRPQFDATLDGLSFGVSSALGFTLASVVCGYWGTLVVPLQGAANISTDELTALARAAVLAALVNACTTGAVAASLWLRQHGRSRQRHQHVWLGVGPALAVAFAAQVGLGLAVYFVASLLLVTALWGIASAVLLVWLRLCLHHALLEEGAEHRVGEASPCPECHRLVPTMCFCPACGVARSAAPRRAPAQPRSARPAPGTPVGPCRH